MFIKAMVSEKGKVKYIKKITAHKCLHGSGIYDGTSNLEREENKLRTYSLMRSYFKSEMVKKISEMP